MSSKAPHMHDDRPDRFCRIRDIRIVSGDHDIDRKVDGRAIMLNGQFSTGPSPWGVTAYSRIESYQETISSSSDTDMMA